MDYFQGRFSVSIHLYTSIPPAPAGGAASQSSAQECLEQLILQGLLRLFLVKIFLDMNHQLDAVLLIHKIVFQCFKSNKFCPYMSLSSFETSECQLGAPWFFLNKLLQIWASFRCRCSINYGEQEPSWTSGHSLAPYSQMPAEMEQIIPPNEEKSPSESLVL